MGVRSFNNSLFINDIFTTSGCDTYIQKLTFCFIEFRLCNQPIVCSIRIIILNGICPPK